MTEHARFTDADGTAALGICELLLLALTDRQDHQRAGRARPAYGCRHLRTEEAAHDLQDPDKHQAVVDIVQRILAGKNGVRT